MRSKSFLLVALVGFGYTAQLLGCGSGSAGGGSGGATGSGGQGTGGSGSGGNGSGGATASGGKTGSGGGTASGGSTGSGGGSGGGTASGGSNGSGGGAASGGNTGSGGAAGSGSGGSTGSGGSAGGANGWSCPPATSFTGSPFTGTTIAAAKIPDAPPMDTFNNMGNDFTNVEGPVWIGDSLYFSEYKTTDVPPSRILKIAPGDTTTVFISDSGSNGLATDGAGNIISANHKAHGIVRFSLPDKTPTTLVSMANGKSLNSPNDLTVAANGTIYFTDPSHQNSSNPQGATRVYQLLPGGTQATVVTDYTMQPNGIALSLDEQTLISGGQSGVKKYPITSGAVAMTGTSFGPSEVTASGVNADGMTLDCAGNLYVAVAGGNAVVVVKPDGSKLGTVTVTDPQNQAKVTNVAFGGTDHQTLYVTAQGAGKGQGVYKIHLSIPGKPF